MKTETQASIGCGMMGLAMFLGSLGMVYLVVKVVAVAWRGL